MTVDLFLPFEYPPLERGDGAEKPMAAGTAIVQKNYYRVKLPRA